jgi:hypothetical protein
MSEKKSAATLLVEIANDLYTFGCVSEQRGHTSQVRGDDPVAVYVFAVPKSNPDVKRPLADIRPDLAAVYQMTYGSVPNATALGDAMTVLEGQARKSPPVGADESLLAILGTAGKNSAATALINLAEEHYTFGVTATGDAYGVPIDGSNVARLLRGGRRSLRAELAAAYYAQHHAAAPGQALTDAMLVLEGKAQATEPTEVALRVAGTDDGDIVLDLGDDDGRAVVVGPGSWRVVETSPVLFRRTRATLPLPVPGPAGAMHAGLGRLRSLLNIDDEEWPLVLAWLVSALFADIPHPVLLLKGEHGTAKSTAAKMLTALIDPCASQLRTAPRNVDDWAVAASGSWMTCLDNISDIAAWLSDAICRAVTGDGLLRRQLFTDSDVSVLAFRRVMAMTSIDPGRLHGDLADRLLVVELARIAEADRAADQSVTAAWRAAHPAVLAGLLDLTTEVLAVLPSVRGRQLPRMADFARVLLAVDKLLGTTGYARYAEQAGQVAEQVVEADSVALAVRARITVSWQGTAGDLLDKLSAERPPKDWPSTPQGMGGRLARAAPALRSLGWVIEAPDRRRRIRVWTITPPNDRLEEQPADMAWMAPSGEPLFDLGEHGADDD